MNSDLCVKIEDGILNIRVGAIIMKDDKFLMVENDRFDHMYSVGGRIKFGETAEKAVVREVYEETGVKMEIRSNWCGLKPTIQRNITLNFLKRSLLIHLKRLSFM